MEVNLRSKDFHIDLCLCEIKRDNFTTDQAALHDSCGPAGRIRGVKRLKRNSRNRQ